MSNDSSNDKSMFEFVRDIFKSDDSAEPNTQQDPPAPQPVENEDKSMFDSVKDILVGSEETETQAPPSNAPVSSVDRQAAHQQLTQWYEQERNALNLRHQQEWEELNRKFQQEQQKIQW